MNNKFPVVEMFNSMQGEGANSGRRSFFIRFLYCNQSCSWCDTKYALGTDADLCANYFDDLFLLDQIKNSGCTNIVLTGGEPTIHSLDFLYVPGFSFHVETNGTIHPEESFNYSSSSDTIISREPMTHEIVSLFNWVVSPKLSNAGFESDFSLLSYWVTLPSVVFKFIIQTNDDIKEVDSLVFDYGINRENVYLSLEGNDLASQLKPTMIKNIIDAGYNFSPRLHSMIWPGERGK